MFGNHNISRRDSLLFGTLAGFGLVGSRAMAACPALPLPSVIPAKAKRCVLVWLDGGPSHLEMFDPKPETSAEVRGPLGVVKTKTAGVVFGEGLKQLARRSDQFAVIRSMTSPVGEHNLATHYALSGHIPGGRAPAPAFSISANRVLERRLPLPTHVAVPNFNLGGGSKLQGYLGESELPWSLNAEPTDKDFQAKIWPSTPALNPTRLARRRALLGQTSGVDPEDRALTDAIQLLTDVDARQAFDLSLESDDAKRRYGGKSIGQSCLLARRLLEAGVPMITVNNKGWDTHDRLKERLQDGYTGAKVPVGLIPSMDQAVAALLDDLHSSGLINETLVIVMGEFGRTPKINTRGGRDHWPRAYSVMLAGAGIQSGVIHGTSDRVGENADKNPVTPSDLVATIYHLLGIDAFERQTTPDGQQVMRVPEQSRIVTEVLS